MLSIGGAAAAFSGLTVVRTQAVANDDLRVTKMIAAIICAESSDLLLLVLVLLHFLLRRHDWICTNLSRRSQVVDSNAREQLICVVMTKIRVTGVLAVVQH